MQFSEIWGYVISAIGAGGITQLLNWRYNRRKNAADLKADEIENMRKAMADFYDPLVAAQNKRIEELEGEIRQLRDDKREMERTHQQQIAQLQEQIIAISAALGIQAQKAIAQKDI